MRYPNRRYIVGGFAGGVLTIAGLRPAISSAQSPARRVESKSGIVVAVDRNLIFIRTADGGLTLKLGGSVHIWKGEDGAPITAIRPGDDLAMRGVMDSDGTFVPTEIWVNIVALDGIIKKVEGSILTLDVVRNDSIAQNKVVRVTGKTLSARDVPIGKEQLQVGREVRVIGLALEDGTVQGTRINVYVNGRPVDSEGSKLLDPLTGKTVERR